MKTTTYKFSQAGLIQGRSQGKNNEVLLMGVELSVMIVVGLLSASSALIVTEAAFPISGVIGKLATSGFAFRTLINAL